MKNCTYCKQTKNEKDFWRDTSRGDGFNARCKECARKHYREKRRRHPENYRQKAKRYYKKNKKKIIKKRLIWYKKNKHKRSAHEKVKVALYNGILIRKPCEKCGEEKVYAHHDDYSRPLDVRWLCASHHQFAHHPQL